MKPIAIPIPELKPALTGLGKFISKEKRGLPVLKCIRIERNAEGRVSLTATTLDASATLFLDATDHTKGEPCIILCPHADLVRVVKAATKDSVLAVAATALHYYVSGQQAKSDFAAIPPAEWPDNTDQCRSWLPLPGADEPLVITAPMRAAIDSAMQCASEDPTRHTINGVGLCRIERKGEEGNIHIIGTDGRCLYASNPFTLPQLAEDIILPRHAFLSWEPFLTDGLTWKLRIRPEVKNVAAALQIEGLRWRFTARPVSGNFPNWRMVVPAKDALPVHVTIKDADELAAALRALPCHDPANRTVGLAISSDGTFALLAKAKKEDDWIRVPVPGAKRSGDPKPVFIFLNRDFLTRAMKLGLTKFQCEEPERPMRFACPAKDSERQMVVMPVRLAEAERPKATAVPAEAAPAVAVPATAVKPQPVENHVSLTQSSGATPPSAADAQPAATAPKATPKPKARAKHTPKAQSQSKITQSRIENPSAADKAAAQPISVFAFLLRSPDLEAAAEAQLAFTEHLRSTQATGDWRTHWPAWNASRTSATPIPQTAASVQPSPTETVATAFAGRLQVAVPKASFLDQLRAKAQ